jgi:hypothetical protein
MLLSPDDHRARRPHRQWQRGTAGIRLHGIGIGECAHFANDPECAEVVIDFANPGIIFGRVRYRCMVGAVAVPDAAALPPDLPVPDDDGAADHLPGLELPRVRLPVTGGGNVLVGEPAGTLIFCYPHIGRPGEELPADGS